MDGTHTLLARFIHWTFIPLYAYGILKQLDDLSQLEDRGLLLFETVFALVFLLIVVLRFAYMRRVPTFHGSHHSPHRLHVLLARTVHRGMYAALVLLPLSGLLIAGLYSRGITSGLLQEGALVVHEFSASLSYVMIATHVGAAIYSRIKGEGVWSSMVPMLKENGPNQHPLVRRVASVEQRFYQSVEAMLPQNKRQ